MCVAGHPACAMPLVAHQSLADGGMWVKPRRCDEATNREAAERRGSNKATIL